MEQLLPRLTRSMPFKQAGSHTKSQLGNFAQRERASVCIQCQWRAFSLQQTRPTRQRPRHNEAIDQRERYRGFRNTSVAKAGIPPREDNTKVPGPPVKPAIPDTVRVAPAEDLPSHKEGQKYAFTKQMNRFMDQLLARLSVAGHEINKYTGTDYSGIEALRQEIKEQEELVKMRHEAVRTAKGSFDEAQTLQMASNKEVVALLERKNSWQSSDLERYMSLIRSEHVNEQNVAVARDRLLEAERGLEEARSRLERRERAQYHEEQIWSDTIRRNSTWLTFGLMGFNVVLLLANIGIVEPWRRRRMVREIKAGMEGKATPQTMAESSDILTTIEKEIDSAIVPEVDVDIDKTEATKEEELLAVAASGSDFIGDSVTAAPLVHEKAGEVVQDVVRDPVNPPTAPPAVGATRKSVRDTVFTAYGRLYDAVMDLFSIRTIALRKVDLTNIVLESTAVGAVITSAIALLILRTR